MESTKYKRPYETAVCAICEREFERDGTDFVLRNPHIDATARICGTCTKNLQLLDLIDIR